MPQRKRIENTISAGVKKLGEILSELHLVIPVYQRPYRWEEKNISSLLDDILEAWQTGKQSYRIGTLILHEESVKDPSGHKIYNIVDGQQRVTTLLLILYILEEKSAKAHIDRLEYPHRDSQDHIRENYKFIKTWIKEHLGVHQNAFLNFLIQHCELVQIIVSDISEAFQMFDAQNGRGKELAAYNLLKAYHIRAMEEDEEYTRVQLDQRWEHATRIADEKGEILDVLGQIFSEQLYRTRRWSRRNEAHSFDKSAIGEFKGLSINKNDLAPHPFNNTHFMILLAKRHLEQIGGNVKGIKSRFKSGDGQNIDPFVKINQDFLNGKAFFDYIESYSQVYQRLFMSSGDTTELREFKQFYKDRCLYKHNRAGDRYLCEAYKSLLFLCFDKFGEEGLIKYYKPLYALIYRKRLEKMQVKYESIAKDEEIKNAFFTLEHSRGYSDLISLEKKSRREVHVQKAISEVEAFFKQEEIILIRK